MTSSNSRACLLLIFLMSVGGVISHPDGPLHDGHYRHCLWEKAWAADFLAPNKTLERRLDSGKNVSKQNLQRVQDKPWIETLSQQWNGYDQTISESFAGIDNNSDLVLSIKGTPMITEAVLLMAEAQNL